MNLLRRKKDGPWYFRFRHPVTGKDTWKSTKTTDRKTAEIAAKALEVRLTRIGFGLEKPDTQRHMPMSEFARVFLRFSEAERAPNTTQLYKQALESFVRIIGDKLLPDITPIDIETFKIFFFIYTATC